MACSYLVIACCILPVPQIFAAARTSPILGGWAFLDLYFLRRLPLRSTSSGARKKCPITPRRTGEHEWSWLETSTMRFVLPRFWGWCSKQKLARVCDSYAMLQRCSILVETWKARHNWNCDKCTHPGVKAIHTANMTNPRGKKDMPARGSDLWHSFRPSHLVMRRSVSRLSLSDNKDRWIRALKGSTA